MFKLVNHNDTLLGEFDFLSLAVQEGKFYMTQTGNQARIIDVYSGKEYWL